MTDRFRRWLAVGVTGTLFGAMVLVGGVTVSADNGAPTAFTTGTLLEQTHDPGDAVVERTDDGATIVPPLPVTDDGGEAGG